MPKPTVYTAFANSIEEFLPNLSAEALQIADTFQPLAFNDKLYYIKDEIFDLDRLVGNFMKYGERFDLFYFSGHASEGCLQLTEKFSAKQDAFSSVITNCLTNIKFLFFNACETFSLAQEIIKKRKNGAQNLVIIACRGKINTFHSEKFATLLLKQIGQPASIRNAYEQARDVLNLMTSENLRFKEFDNKTDVLAAGDDFDIGYIEIPGDHHNGRGSSSEAEGKHEKEESMIGDDKLTRDILTANYVTAVVESLSSPNATDMPKEKVEIISKALKAAQAVAKGKKEPKDYSTLFDEAATVMPGISSGKTFNSLINTQKQISNPYVKSFIDKNGFGIGKLVKQVSTISK